MKVILQSSVGKEYIEVIMIIKDRILKEFIELVKIDSLSLNERKMADKLKQKSMEEVLIINRS